MPWKIGEVIQRTGLTARALHFYEEKGLIGPVPRSFAGHRLYTQSDLLRLQQIRYMRLLGISLADMAEMFKKSKLIIPQLNQQLLQLRKKREAIQELENRLSTLVEGLESQNVSPDELDELLFQTMETMMMYEQYFQIT